jgi:hypothetical protein
VNTIYRTSLLACAIALGLAGTAQAQVDISGFGQIVAGNDLDDGAFPTLGYDEDSSIDPESLFAVQIRGTLNEQWSATAQVVARGAEEWDPKFAWAYVSYQDGGLSVRLGKQRLPLYRYSDFLEVGYAYQWMRPPQSVYNIGFSEFSGINVGYSWFTGDWTHRAQAVFGRADDDNLEIRSQVGVTFDSTYNDWLSLRASYFQSDVTVQSDGLLPLLGGLNAAGLGDVASLIAVDGDKGSFFGLGVEMDRNNLLLGAEYVEVEIENSLLSKRSEYYVYTGYRFGTVTPTLTYGRRNNDAQLDALEALPAGNPLAPTIAGILIGDSADDTYTSIGVRWDFARNVAFKADYTDFKSDLAFREDAALLSAGIVFTF